MYKVIASSNITSIIFSITSILLGGVSHSMVNGLILKRCNVQSDSIIKYNLYHIQHHIHPVGWCITSHSMVNGLELKTYNVQRYSIIKYNLYHIQHHIHTVGWYITFYGEGTRTENIQCTKL